VDTLNDLRSSPITQELPGFLVVNLKTAEVLGLNVPPTLEEVHLNLAYRWRHFSAMTRCLT
jgi:hypothetical protein